MRTHIRKLGLTAACFAALAVGAPTAVDACGSQPFIGEICTIPYGFCPRGYAEAVGQLLDISVHEALFSLIGTTYGGNGRTTFALPDLRGRVPIGVDQTWGRPNRPLGRAGGIPFVTLEPDQLPAHSHVVTDLPLGDDATATLNGTSRSADSLSPDRTLPATTRSPIYGTSGPGVAMAGNAIAVSGGTNGATQPTGGRQAFDNRQPYIVLRYCIALAGVMPVRN